MKKILALLTILMCLSLTTFGQQRKANKRFVELGFLLGVTNYSGDLAEARIEYEETRPGFGAFLRYHINPALALKGHAYYGAISGDDANTSRTERSFRFGTSLFEFGAVVEWNFFAKERISHTGMHNFQITPYVFAGLGGAFTNPTTEFYGKPGTRNQFLKVPLPEDGLQKNFFTTPIGVGFRVDVFDRFILGLDAGIRPTFSDAIDGISINGNPDKGDWYYFLGFTASLVINDPYQMMR